MTDLGLCSQCGESAQVCYFKARRMIEGELCEEKELCYGCGLCLEVCPEDCIQMAGRD